MNRHLPMRDTSNPDILVERIRSIIGTVALDCDCRQRVNDALGRFVEMEQQRETRRHLLSSRHHRAAIAALVDLLTELEDISWQETDRGVFAEFAHLFEDIAEHAMRGATELRQMGNRAP
ncbi:hypothetical protein [Devosia sediminis]|uniref:Uncharacterized protein n=1 Tax=Devosia sediminis TaxID=2798801 RepID=A0A934MIN4_9HYPH|nr:hypothetical protein [Devosia sediminis]MBJ3783138.1 hypothetical protein [Devosia sediminis]